MLLCDLVNKKIDEKIPQLKFFENFFLTKLFNTS